MKRDDFEQLMEDLIEAPRGGLTGNLTLEAVGWDSLKTLEFLALVDRELGCTLAPGKIAGCETVNDVFSLVAEHFTN